MTIGYRPIFLCAILAFAAASAHAGIITDFSTQNPLTFADPGSTWALPTNQFEFFTSGNVSGQEIVPLAGGDPTVSGGAGVLGLNLNLSGATGLQLTARLLPADQATAIQVLLFDADGTILRFNYPTSDFNTSTFSSALVSFTAATTVLAGSIPGFNLANVTTYEVQGDFFDPGGSGTAVFSAQFDDLIAVGAPEPSTAWLSGLAIGMVGIWVSRSAIRTLIHRLPAGY